MPDRDVSAGGTLIVLGYLLTGGRHIHASAEGERAVTVWGDFLGLLSANTAGGSNRAEDNSAVRPSVPGES
jgi:hypothetical protein